MNSPGADCGAGAFACQPHQLSPTFFCDLSVSPSTIRGAGAFACRPQPHMFYRRRLPHWHPDLTEATFLFLTWRLAGSVPGRPMRQPPTSGPLTAGRAFLALDREADKATCGPVWLRDARVARVVAHALLYGERERHLYQLRAWVIMPNHVHVLLRPTTSVPRITRWLKGSTARQANVILGRTGEAFWQDESFDHRVRDEAELDRIVAYIERNPVGAGLAASAAEWPWSSAGLAGGAPSGPACPTAGSCHVRAST